MNFDQKLKAALKKNIELIDTETDDLARNEIINRAFKADKELVGLLIKDKKIRETFFNEIENYWVFNINKFVDYIENIKILSNSYTKFKNKIGLTNDNKFLKERGEVALIWPFKDCVLEGGMTKEDQKRNEIFFNEILAKDEIDRLFDPKVLTNFKRYTAKGQEKVKDFNRDKDGTIKDNLVIKGNNLLALHSLKKEFAGKVKLIYIDPPYNTGGDSFKYNDNFNHSSWLTFMKNRLEVAKELLGNEGSIFIQVDHHEVGYINILMDEIFGIDNKVQIISLKTASPSGFKAVNPGPIDVTEYILFYTKNKPSFKFKRNYVPTGYNKNYNQYLDNKDSDVKNWKFTPIRKKVLEINRFSSEKEAKKKFGFMYKEIMKNLIAEFAFKNADNVISIRDLHKPTDKVKQLKDWTKKNKGKIKIYKKVDGTNMYFYNGGSLAFYSNKIKEIDGEKKVVELLSDFWNHISWAGIAKEGAITLKNGKKPEKLIKQICEIATEKGDLVLDYHLGSGTTCAVAHKMDRKYIGIEQLDYGENDSVVRLNNVVKGDQSGISKSVDWKGGGEFTYCELQKYNEEVIEKIQKAKDTKILFKIWDEMCEKYFLNYDVKIKDFNDNKKGFENMTLKQQKEVLVEMLNKNQLYVNLSEIGDSQFKVSKEDKELNKKFYNN